MNSRIPPKPAYCAPAAFDAFSLELREQDNARSLFRAAFAISLHERPEADLREVESTVEKLADTVRSRVRSSSHEAVLAHLHDVLFDVFGLKGNSEDYYNPANSYLSDIFKTKLGIPISLVLIYKRVAEPLGIVVHGVNAPGHFLAEVELPGPSHVQSMYVDPFYGGGLLNRSEVLERVSEAIGKPVADQPEMFQRATSHTWLGRMLNNLQASFAVQGNDRNVCAMEELRSLLSSF